MSENYDNDNFLNGNGIIILILFLLFGWGGFGGGMNSNAAQGALTRAELYEGLNSQNTFSEFRSIQNQIQTGFDANALAMSNGFSSMTNAMNCGVNGIQMSLNNGFNGIQQAIADSNYRMADCCCQIKNAVHSEGEQTRALIQSNTIQDLRDRVADKDRELLATGLTAAQAVQTNNLENFIRSALGGCGCGC